MSERELLCVMAAIVHAGKEAAGERYPNDSAQECADTALCLMQAVDRRLYASYTAPAPKATTTLPTP